jgi:glycerophosphoryl diester phosphodiesterase
MFYSLRDIFMTALFPHKILFAHRGASADAPENTVPAMQLAKKLGAKWVEFDVTLSKDGELFVFHDKMLERTTNLHGQIARKSAVALSQADAGSWFSPMYADASIPTLKEMLAALMELDLNMNLEIKPHDNRVTELVVKILDTVKTQWPKQRTPPIFSSFSHQAMIELRQRDAGLKLGLLLKQWSEQWEAEADGLNCETVHLHIGCATPEHVNAIKKTGRKVFCYTVNTIELAQDLFTMGVDGLFSDHADLLHV